MGDAIRPSGYVTVIGGGVVGACAALSLRRAGFEVTLIERADPGGACSFGNAGLLSVSGVVPIATPGILWSVPRLLLNPMGPLTVRWSYLPRLMPWLFRFLAASTQARVEEISIALASLLAHGHDCYRALLEEAEFADLARGQGVLYVYETDQSYEGSKSKHDLRRRRGIRLDYVPREQLRQLEPSLSPAIRHGVLVPDTRFVVDPQRLVRTLVARLEKEGGAVERAELTRFDLDRDGRPVATIGGATRKLDRVVIAAGAWSKAFAAQCGARLPLDTERGYHAVLPRPGVSPRVAVMSGDHDFAITPMEAGLRLAGTVELGGLAAPPNYERAKLLVRLGATIFPGLSDEDASYWMGFRPSMPDSLPVIGPVPGSDRVFLAFGHGHLGLTLGAVTGRLIADLIAGRAPIVDPAPFSAARF